MKRPPLSAFPERPQNMPDSTTQAGRRCEMTTITPNHLEAALHEAWALIHEAMENWESQPEAWLECAEKWRDERYNPFVDQRIRGSKVEYVADDVFAEMGYSMQAIKDLRNRVPGGLGLVEAKQHLDAARERAAVLRQSETAP